MKLLTGNELRSGAVTWWTGSGWSLHVEDAVDVGEHGEAVLHAEEGARILEEGIAYRGSDIDVVWTSGYGFPDYQGGPMFLADERGLSHVVQRLDHYASTRSNPFGYWTVSPLLRRLASEGRRLSQYAN